MDYNEKRRRLYRNSKLYREKCISQSGAYRKMNPTIRDSYDSERYVVMQNVRQLTEYLKNIQELIFE